MNKACLVLVSLVVISCSSSKKYQLSIPTPTKDELTGSAFYKNVTSLSREERETLAIRVILSGNIPDFLKHLVPIHSTLIIEGKKHKAVFYVMPDYLSIGTSDDWARIPLTPMAATQIADSFHCFLPTRKMVDLVYEQSTIKLEPVPMYAFRDSSATMWQHHLIIEGQRNGRKGLIAGIKKDVVISEKVLADARGDRVAIYGWHQLNGKPIQPLYTGHVNWYVDYSHGIRLVYRKIWVDGKDMDYTEVLQHPLYKMLLCDEENCNHYHYRYK